MGHIRKSKKYERKENCTGYCEPVIDMLTEQAYAKGYKDCHDKMIDRMIMVIETTFTVIGTIVGVVTLVGVVLRVFIKRRTECFFVGAMTSRSIGV